MGQDPIKSATEGAVLATLEWTEQKVRDCVKQFQNRKLAFIKNADNIELVKDERNSSEFSIIRQFVPKGAYSIQIQMGLALREIADDQTKVNELVGKIVKKYGQAGLHVAETTEIGITTQLLAHLVKFYRDPAEVKGKFIYFLNHIEELVIFVKKKGNPHAINAMITHRIDAFTTHIIIVFGSGYAKDIVVEALKLVKKNPRGFFIEVTEKGLQITAFIFTPELKARISHWSDPFGSEED